VFYFKAAQTCELMDDWGKALENYQIIHDKYPKSKQALEIDRYIGRAEAKLDK